MPKKAGFRIFVILILTIVVASFLGCSSSPSPSPTQKAPSTTVAASPTAAPQKVIQWEFNSVLSSDMKTTAAERQYFVDEVNKRSGGRLKIVWHDNSSMGFSGADVLTAVKAGTAQASDSFFAYQGKDIPSLGAIELPLIIQGDDFKKVSAALAATKAIRDREFLKWNVMELFVYPDSPSRWFLKKPITKLDDLRGMKMRAAGVTQAEIIKAVGGTPVTMVPAELYTAMQQGLVEGVQTNTKYAVFAKYYEVMGYVVTNPLTTVNGIVLVNKTAFDSLPADLQQLMKDIAAEAKAKLEDPATGVPNDEKIYADQLQQKGAKMITLSAADMDKLTKMMPSVWDQWGTMDSASAEAIKAIRAISGR